MTNDEVQKMRVISANIQWQLEIRAWAWSELASRAEVSQSTISRIKNAQFEPGIFTMRKIASVLGTTTDWLCEEHAREFVDMS